MNDSLSTCKGLVTVGCHIYNSTVNETENTVCIKCVNETVWWPEASADIKCSMETWNMCQKTSKHSTKRRYNLHHCLSGLKDHHIMMLDSCCLEILHLPTTRLLLKSTFARFGIPDQIVSDNSPQYTGETWKDFCRQHDTVHVTSSPHNHGCNGCNVLDTNHKMHP